MEYKHLVCVTGVNNNKYYDMRQLNDDTFEAVYGRIGVTANKAIYPISRWKSILNQKLRKGYEDMTDLAVVTETTTVEKYKPIEDADIAALVEFLRQQARDTIQKNYTIGSEKVSQAMVDTAQGILNDLAGNQPTIRSFNDKLLELFTVIPRRMEYVPDYLASTKNEFEKIIHREQELLDVMAGQVSDNEAVTNEVGDESMTVLEAFGLEISPADEKDVEIIKKELGKECEGLFSGKSSKNLQKERAASPRSSSGTAAVLKTGGVFCAPAWSCAPLMRSSMAKCSAMGYISHPVPGNRLDTLPCAVLTGLEGPLIEGLWHCMRWSTESPTMFLTTMGVGT